MNKLRNDHFQSQGSRFDLLKLLEHIFNGNFIYSHPDIKQLVKKYAHNYIPIQQVLQTQTCRQLALQNQHLILSPYQIERAINSGSTTLVCKNYKIRKQIQFIDKFEQKNIFPTFIQKFPNNMQESDMRALLQQFTKIYGLYFKHTQSWCMAFSEDPISIVNGINQYKQTLNPQIRAYRVQQSIQIYKTTSQLYHRYLKQTIYKNKDIKINVQTIRSPINNNKDTQKLGYASNRSKKRYHKQMIQQFQYYVQRQEQKRQQTFKNKVDRMINYDNQVFINYLSNNQHQRINNAQFDMHIDKIEEQQQNNYDDQMAD